MALLDLFRSTWQRLLLHGVHYGDRHSQLELLYRIKDPWQLDCEREHFRFDAINAIIRREIGTPATVLEIGCGEGLQSARLMEVCRALHGIDISPTAIARARRRCPAGVFEAGDINSGFRPSMSRAADLVIACEVVYYVKDIESFLDTVSGLGRYCLISYFAAHRATLDPVIARRPAARSEVIRFGDAEWVAAWWKTSIS